MGLHRSGAKQYLSIVVLCLFSGVTLRNVRVVWGETRPDYFGSALEAHDVPGLELTDFKGQAAHPGKLPDRIVEE